MTERETAGLAAARRALRLRKGPATDGDRPPPSTFPGRKATVLEGQLCLGDGGKVIHDEDESVPRTAVKPGRNRAPQP